MKNNEHKICYIYLKNTAHHIRITYDNHNLEVEHDGQIMKVDHIKAPNDKQIYISFSSSTGRRYSSSMIHNLMINNEPAINARRWSKKQKKQSKIEHALSVSKTIHKNMII